MSPRLDASPTPIATSTPPPDQLDHPIDALDLIEGLPEIPRTMRSARSTRGPFPRPSSSDWSRWRKGTHEFAYVRNTLVELNLALVKFAASPLPLPQ